MTPSSDESKSLSFESPNSKSVSKLRPLSDEEYDEARKRAGSKIPLSNCPTCLAKPTDVTGSGIKELIPGTYRYLGHTYPCDCKTQIKLRTHYLVANIGDQYQRLDWGRDYQREGTAKEALSDYLAKWPNYKQHGIGIQFCSSALGTGKTFAATYIGRELIKRGQKVFFVPFVDMVAAFETNGRALEEKMRNITYLVLDDILRPISERQREFYAFRLEALIRWRTNYDLPTITTTNLMAGDLEESYPRAFSLLLLKQIPVVMTGNDVRGDIGMDNMELAANGEIRPIS